MIAFLEGIRTDDYNQKLINCLSRGGLTTVHNGCVPIILMAEELFQNDIMGILTKLMWLIWWIG